MKDIKWTKELRELYFLCYNETPEQTQKQLDKELEQAKKDFELQKAQREKEQIEQERKFYEEIQLELELIRKAHLPQVEDFEGSTPPSKPACS